MSDEVGGQIKPAVVANDEIGQIIRSVGTRAVVAVNGIAAGAAQDDIAARVTGNRIRSAVAVQEGLDDIQGGKVGVDGIVINQFAVVTQNDIVAVITADVIRTAVDAAQDNIVSVIAENGVGSTRQFSGIGGENMIDQAIRKIDLAVITDDHVAGIRRCTIDSIAEDDVATLAAQDEIPSGTAAEGIHSAIRKTDGPQSIHKGADHDRAQFAFKLVVHRGRIA